MIKSKVLIIEDDEDIREQLILILEDEGYEVHSVENGRLGLDYLKLLEKTALPNCIILDLMMPVMNGLEFIKAIENDSILKQIPIIIATAKGSPKVELEDIPLHIGKINKPMEVDDLLNLIQKYCDTK